MAGPAGGGSFVLGKTGSIHWDDDLRNLFPKSNSHTGITPLARPKDGWEAAGLSPTKYLLNE